MKVAVMDVHEVVGLVLVMALSTAPILAVMTDKLAVGSLVYVAVVWKVCLWVFEVAVSMVAWTGLLSVEMKACYLAAELVVRNEKKCWH